MQSNNGTWVYWEKQGTDRLCAVHCINSILQGPFYTEVRWLDFDETLKLSLAEIARELDSQEKELLMGQGTESKDFLNYIAV